MDEHDTAYCAQLAYVQGMVQQIADKTKKGTPEYDALDAILEFLVNERDAKSDQG